MATPYTPSERSEKTHQAPSPTKADSEWTALPERLRGRGDFLLKRGRIKDAELMFDAATEIEGLRQQGAA